ncbi:hypothetical protein, partial [Staphylococcus epidermidis]|uniref:hypothetical protein n=1 Tax=Staphylococcus epidermidis TaxID=1282 RepID=UPI001C9335FD
PLHATILSVNNHPPHIDTNQIPTHLTLHTQIFFHAQTTPITKHTTYKLTQSIPNQIYQTTINPPFNSSPHPYPPNFLQPLNQYWP